MRRCEADLMMPHPMGELVDENCPDCGHLLVKKSGKYGKFLGCTNYPKCKYSQKKEGRSDRVGRDCPECGSHLTMRYGKRGKFIGCEGYSSKGCDYSESLIDRVSRPSHTVYGYDDGHELGSWAMVNDVYDQSDYY